jgi:acetylornithine deacetylase/succinyl-diaminopimelate desuccinylase-like protein
MTASAANHRITALASDRATHAAFRWLHLHEPRLRRWQHELLAIPAPPFGEAPRARWFAARFTELGLANAHLDAEGNALAELHPNTAANAPIVLLSAHLDTVFPAGTPCNPRDDEARILCPGATDNGAGLTALLALAAALRAAEIAPACTLLFAANVGEEGEGDLRGMRHLFSASPYAPRIKAVLALEGAGAATVVDRALGSRRLRAEIAGPGGHSWADFGRPNPILALAEGLTALARLPLPANPRTTLNVGAIAGGTSINSIPAEAHADLDLRSTSTAELDTLESAVLKTLSKAVQSAVQSPVQSSARRGRKHDTLRLQVRRIGDRTAGALAHDSSLFTSLRAVDRHLGLTTEPRLGSTDANLPLSLGIPALALGAGGEGGGIHTLDEWYSPLGRDIALRRILLLLLDTCALTAANARDAS